MKLPHDHPLRAELNDEVHARPPEAFSGAQRISYLAVLADQPARDAGTQPIAELAARFGYPPPAERANHFSADLGPFRVRWERHTEFFRYQFSVAGVPSDPFADPAIAVVPKDWLAALPGQVIVAAHLAFLPAPASLDPEKLSQANFAGNVIVGSTIADDGAAAFTDFRIHDDGFSRILLLVNNLAPRQAGRTVQRLLEIDTYRIMALLALPLARELSPSVGDRERDLAGIVASMTATGEADDPQLLDRLTRLEAEIEQRYSQSYARFSAAAAYYDLVRRRILELRERRVQGLQTFQEFTERRLAPAMATCQAMAARQSSLSQRVAQTTQLLSTRVDIARERHNQAILEQMNRRAHLQLRLQETVEGLSVAAITYYVTGILGYAFKGAKAAGYKIDVDLAVGLSIPVVLLLVAFGLKRLRRLLIGDSVADETPHA